MKISRERLLAEAKVTRFRPEVLEKAIHLLNLLENFQSHPFLKDKLALKGGTALNLFLFDLPRLSVDIDLNYIGAVQREKMEEERPRIEQAIQAVCSREGLNIIRIPGDHAGGKWRLRYESALGEGVNLELDLNFMFRIPLWPVAKHESRSLGSFKVGGIPICDMHEIAAGKLAALLTRHASRDLFDVHMLLTRGKLNVKKLRLGFILYGAMNRKDWRMVRAHDVEFDPREIKDQLIPVVRRDFPDDTGLSKEWALRLVKECRQRLDIVLPLTTNERKFLDRLLDQGEIEPSLLTSDKAMTERIKTHPLLQWKALNVCQYNMRQLR